MARRIRVTQVLEATAGGTRRHLKEVVAALSSDEFELHIVCAIGRDPTFREDVDAYRRSGHSVSVLPMTPGPHPLRDLSAAQRLRRLLRRKACDILHLHSAKAGWIGRIAARELPCRVIYAPHGFRLLQGRAPQPLRWTYRAAERLPAPRTDILLAVSEAEGRLAVESGLYDAGRVRVLPNALDVRRFDEQMAKLPPARRRSAVPTFGLVGDLRVQKGPLVFLKAVRLLRERGIPIPVVLPLHGPELERAREYVRRHDLGPLVDFVAAENSLEVLLQRSDVAVLPSFWEGLPYTMLEVLALRRPLIASDLPVFQDLLRPLDPRLIFRVGSADALAERMALWARLPAAELESVGERGRRWVLEHHGFAAWQEGLREIYRPLSGHRAES